MEQIDFTLPNGTGNKNSCIILQKKRKKKICRGNIATNSNCIEAEEAQTSMEETAEQCRIL